MISWNGSLERKAIQEVRKLLEMWFWLIIEEMILIKEREGLKKPVGSTGCIWIAPYLKKKKKAVWYNEQSLGFWIQPLHLINRWQANHSPLCMCFSSSTMGVRFLVRTYCREFATCQVQHFFAVLSLGYIPLREHSQRTMLNLLDLTLFSLVATVSIWYTVRLTDINLYSMLGFLI